MDRHARVRIPGASSVWRSDAERSSPLRVVPPASWEPPRLPRPHWMLLYTGVGLASATGLALSIAAAPGFWRTAAGAVTLVTVFGTMLVWIHMNRLALADRSRGPRPIDWPLIKHVVLSTGRPGRRPPRAEAHGKAVRLAPHDDDALPYDFD